MGIAQNIPLDAVLIDGQLTEKSYKKRPLLHNKVYGRERGANTSQCVSLFSMSSVSSCAPFDFKKSNTKWDKFMSLKIRRRLLVRYFKVVSQWNRSRHVAENTHFGTPWRRAPRRSCDVSCCRRCCKVHSGSSLMSSTPRAGRSADRSGFRQASAGPTRLPAPANRPVVTSLDWKRRMVLINFHHVILYKIN